MAILIIKDLARADIDAIKDKMDGTYDPIPKGLIAQAVTAIDEGERVVEIWSSEEDYEEFRTNVHGPRIHAAIKELGDSVTFQGALSMSVAPIKTLLVGER